MTRTALADREARRQALADVSKARDEAIELMNPALKKKLQSLEKQIGGTRTDNLRFYWNIGRELMEIRDKPEVYDPGAVTLLEKAMSMQKRLLRKCEAFARAYDANALQELLVLVEPKTGFCLHWGHVSYLLTLRTAGKRQMWAKRAVRALWSPADLHQAVQKQYGRSPAAHGRHYELPASLAAQVRQIKKECNAFLGRYNDAWDGDKRNAFNNILSAPPDEYTPEMLADMQAARAALEGIVEAAQGGQAKIDRILARMVSCLQAAELQRQEAASSRRGNRGQRPVDMAAAGT